MLGRAPRLLLEATVCDARCHVNFERRVDTTVVVVKGAVYGITRMSGTRAGLNERSQPAYAMPRSMPVDNETGHVGTNTREDGRLGEPLKSRTERTTPTPTPKPRPLYKKRDNEVLAQWIDARTLLYDQLLSVCVRSPGQL